MMNFIVQKTDGDFCLALIGPQNAIETQILDSLVGAELTRTEDSAGLVHYEIKPRRVRQTGEGER